VHFCEDLIHLFNHCFAESHQTRLVKGDDEPLYLPMGVNGTYHQIMFAHGFFSSALHEIAHWLIAGPERRQMQDYGYWYAPDGRNLEQQEIFQQVEVKPQALEWILSSSCGHPFHFSFDNLSGEVGNSMNFKKAIHHQVLNYCEQGLSARAEQFRQALCHFYGQPQTLMSSSFEFLTR
jgi:elongation factor P hydroxylase